MGNGISFGSFNDGLVEEIGISIPLNIPVLFIALFMVGFLGQDDTVLVLKIFLEANVLLVGRAHL